MRHLPTILLLLSFPAGILGYALGVQIMSALPLPDEIQGFLVLFAPLFIAGLCMLPFLVPFFDRMARRDAAANGSGDKPGGSTTSLRRGERDE
jgi:hypothetical protein